MAGRSRGDQGETPTNTWAELDRVREKARRRGEGKMPQDGVRLYQFQLDGNGRGELVPAEPLTPEQQHEQRVKANSWLINACLDEQQERIDTEALDRADRELFEQLKRRRTAGTITDFERTLLDECETTEGLPEWLL